MAKPNLTQWISSLELPQNATAQVTDVAQQMDMTMDDLFDFKSKQELVDNLGLQDDVAGGLWTKMVEYSEKLTDNDVKSDETIEESKSDSNISTINNEIAINNTIIGNVVGFVNLGNTCFMNTALQVCLNDNLYYIYMIYEFILINKLIIIHIKHSV